MSNLWPLIDLFHPVQSYDISINLIHRVIIHAPWLPRLLLSKLGFFIFFVLFYSFVMPLAIIQLTDSKNIHFYYVSNLLVVSLFFGTATTKRCGKSPLFSGAGSSHAWSIIFFYFFFKWISVQSSSSSQLACITSILNHCIASDNRTWSHPNWFDGMIPSVNHRRS